MLAGLAGFAALQFALPTATTLPDDPGLAPRRARPIVAAPITADPEVLRAPITSPDRAPGEAVDPTAGGDAQTLQVVGAAVGGRVASAIVRRPDGSTRVIGLGASVDGLKLVALSSELASFMGPAGRVTIKVAPAAPVPTAPTESPH